jgi:ankyrin repeat protein
MNKSDLVGLAQLAGLVLLPTILTLISLYILLVKGRWNSEHYENGMKNHFMLVLSACVLYLIYAPTLFFLFNLDPNYFTKLFMCLFHTRLPAAVVLALFGLYAVTRKRNQYMRCGIIAMAVGICALLFIDAVHFLRIQGWNSKGNWSINHKSSPTDVSFLLNGGIDIDADYGEILNTVLLKWEDPEKLGWLLDKGAIPDYSHLFSVVQKKRPRLVKLLIQHGADPNSKDRSGFSALAHAYRNKAARCAGILRANGAKYDIFCALHNSDISGMREMLDRDPQLLNAKIPGRRLLQFAISAKKSEIIKLLHSYGVPLNGYNTRSETPLHMALQPSDVPTSRMLIKLGANIDFQSWHLLLNNRRLWKELLPDFVAAGTIVEETSTFGLPPLLHAVTRDNLDAVRLMVNTGADVNVVDRAGNTALHKAVELNNPEIIILLLNNGADPKIKNMNGLTPLGILEKSSWHKIFQSLKEHKGKNQ